MTICQATPSQLAAAAKLAGELWPSHTAAQLERELAPLLSSPHGVILLAWQGELPVGYAQCQLRRDYVEGTSSSPVGYLEGIYVSPAHRGRGIASQLLQACQHWARLQGCREFASDCALENSSSLAFHLRTGFREAGRIICFVQQL